MSETAESLPEVVPTVPEAPDGDTEQAAPTAAVTGQDEKPDPNVTANGERLDRQTRNWRALERDRDYWREMAVRNVPQQAPPPAAPVQADQPKTLADFNYDEAKFQSHLFEQAETRAIKAARHELEQQTQRETERRRGERFAQRELEYSKTVEDYQEITRNPTLPISYAMAEAIAESDDGPALAYHLGKNMDLASRLAGLPPLAAAREIGRIEARLAQERESAKKAVSKAPPPPAKVEGVDPGRPAISTTSPESDKLSDDEWVKAERKRMNRKKA